MKLMVAFIAAAALLVITTGEVMAQSRGSIRCKNNGYLNGKWYCNVSRAIARGAT